MAIAVNLLNDKHILSEREYQLERTYLSYTVIAFTVVAVITIALGLLSFFYTNKLNVIEDDIARSTDELSTLTEASAQQIYLKNRLQLITAFLDGRTVDREAMQRVFTFSIPGVVVSSVGFESENNLGIQLTADHAGSLEEAVKLMSAPTSFFTQVVSKSITRTPEGKYQMQLVLTVPRSTT